MAVNFDRECKRKLSCAEQDFYEKNGYVIVPNVLPIEELNALNQELHRLWSARAADSSLSAEHVNNIHGLGEISPQSEALATDERIIGLIEDLVSPGIALFSAKMISKAPHQTDMVCHWHQDDAYWHDIYQSDCRLSVWIPLQDATRENGCLRVVPGSHKTGVLPHEPRSSRAYGACRLSFLPGEAELPKALYCPINAGSILIFHSRTQHSSLGNHTGEHRRAFILTYQEATLKGAASNKFKVIRPE